MQAKELTLRFLNQSQENLTKSLDGLTQEEVAWSPGAECNNIAFIFWHISRVEDFFVNRVIQRQKELYDVEGWQQKLGTPDKAYQLTLEELQEWPVPKLEVLFGYANAVREKTLSFVQSIPNEHLSELARPERPPDTIGDILSNLVFEIQLHVGQIAYLHGMLRGLDK